MVSVLRPGQRSLNIPGIGVQTSRRAVQVAAAADWWAVAGKTCMAAYQPKGAVDLATSYVNLANPGTYNAAPGSAPSLDADGWVGNGTAWLRTGIIPLTTYSIFARFSGVTGDTVPIGVYNYTNSFLIGPRGSAGAKVVYFNGNYLEAAPAMSSGVMALAGLYGYRNGSVDAGPLGGCPGAIGFELHLLAFNLTGVATSKLVGKVQAVAIYSDTLTAGEVATVSAAMAAL